jgi:hypothetical protein
LCWACAERLGGGGELGLDGLLRWAFVRWKRHWFALTLSGLVLSAIGLVGVLPLEALQTPRWVVERGAWWEIAFSQLKTAGGNAVQSVLSPVFYGYWLDVLAGKPWSNAAARARARAIPAQALVVAIYYLATAFCIALCIGVFMLTGAFDGWPQSMWAVLSLLIVLSPVLVYVLIGTSFISFQLAEAPRSSALEALKLSWKLAAGRRWELGGILGVAALISWSGLFACVVGVLVSFPLGMLLHGALFLACKKNAL